MSGSIKWMIYKDDGGTEFAVRVDESVGEATGFGDFTGLSSAPPLPKGYKMRYANLVRLDGEVTRRRRAAIGDPAVFATFVNGGAITIDTFLWQVTSLQGEKRVIPYAFDTGANDADVT